MKTVNVSLTTLETLIEGLEESVNVCYTAPKKEGQGYPYAAGYSRGAMEMIISNLEALKTQTN
jgi:hypothetical protein